MKVKWFASLPPAFFSQRWQPMQPMPQTLVTSGPFSGLLQSTWIVAEAGTSSMSLRGHTLTHLPQPMQRRLSTMARPSSTRIACFGHTFAQAP